MKEKLEVVTNIVLIGLARLIGYQFWHARRTPASPRPASVKVGDRLPSLPAYDWRAQGRTLVLALKNGCRFCEESIPSYRKLAELEKSNQIDAHLIRPPETREPYCPQTLGSVIGAAAVHLPALRGDSSRWGAARRGGRPCTFPGMEMGTRIT